MIIQKLSLLRNIDAFCDLARDQDIETKLQAAAQNLSAAESAHAIRQQQSFVALSLLAFDLNEINVMLSRGLAELVWGYNNNMIYPCA